MAYLVDNCISILFVSETWLTDLNNCITATIKSYGFDILHQPRKDVRGGGVGIIFHRSFTLTRLFVKHGSMFEAICAKFRDGNGDNVLCSCVYRPENSKDLFFTEFDEFIGSIFIKFHKIIICGDFNIHLDLPN